MMLRSKMFQLMLMACWIQLFLSASMVFSAETKLLTSVDLRHVYNDNITYRRSDKIDDFISIVSPSVEISYITEIFSLSALADWRGSLYWDNSDLNRVNQRYGLDGTYRLTERWSFTARGRYTKDSVQDSQLDETGSVRLGLSDREKIGRAHV